MEANNSRTCLWVLSVCSILISSVLVNTACSPQTQPAAEQEFVAGLSDMNGFRSWTRVDSLYRTDNKEIRFTFVNKASEVERLTAKTGSGSYPTGTILVKEIRAADTKAVKRYQVMVKRGGGFNTVGKGWEWILLNSDFSQILSRGGDTVTVNGTPCRSCHEGQNDLVFQHAPR